MALGRRGSSDGSKSQGPQLEGEGRGMELLYLPFFATMTPTPTAKERTLGLRVE